MNRISRVIGIIFVQGPSKAISAAVPLRGPTFLAASAEGRVLSFSGSDYTYVDGPGHSTLVAGLAAASDGKVFSAGLDDKVLEVTDGSSFA